MGSLVRDGHRHCRGITNHRQLLWTLTAIDKSPITPHEIIVENTNKSKFTDYVDETDSL